MSRILVFVPNTATSDRRVIRHSDSLQRAGHTVEIVGVTTTDHPSQNAITDEQVPVTRINWRAATYQRIFRMVYWRYLRYGLIALAVLALVLFAILIPGYRAFASVFPNGAEVYNVTIPAVAIYSAIMLGAVVGFAILSVVVQLGSNRIKRKGAIANLIRARQVAENYASLEQAQQDDDSPMLFKFFRWVASLSSRDDDVTFKATVDSRIKAMTEYGLEWAPDIVYCHEAATLPVGAALKRKLGCKLIYDAHEIYDDLANASPVQSETYQDIHRKYLGLADHFITVNPRILGFYTTNYDQLKDYTVIPNTVFPDTGADYDGRLHEKAKLDINANVLLYQGGFSPHRGLDKLVASASRLPENWFLVMMGWGKLEDELREIAEASKQEMIAEFRQEELQKKLLSDSFLSRLAELSLIASADDVKTLSRQGIQSNRVEDLTRKYGAEAAVSMLRSGELLGEGDETFSVQAYILKRFLDTNDKMLSGSAANNPKAIIERLSELERQAIRAFSDNEVDAQKIVESNRYKIGYDHILNELNTEIQKDIGTLNRRGVFDKVRFIPGAPHEELVSWSKGATVGVIPYENVGANHWNCSPNKIWEYANADTPILASRMLYINEVIQEHGIGWTFSTDFTPKDISRAVKRLTPEDIEEKVKNCRAFIKAENYLHYEKKLLNIFG